MCAVQWVFITCNFTLLLFLVHLWVDKNHEIIFCMAAQKIRWCCHSRKQAPGRGTQQPEFKIHCFWNGLAMRSCIALRTMSSYLWQSIIMGEKRIYTCMCNWVTMLYSRKKICIGEITIKKKNPRTPPSLCEPGCQPEWNWGFTQRWESWVCIELGVSCKLFILVDKGLLGTEKVSFSQTRGMQDGYNPVKGFCSLIYIYICICGWVRERHFFSFTSRKGIPPPRPSAKMQPTQLDMVALVATYALSLFKVIRIWKKKKKDLRFLLKH